MTGDGAVTRSWGPSPRPQPPKLAWSYHKKTFSPAVLTKHQLWAHQMKTAQITRRLSQGSLWILVWSVTHVSTKQFPWESTWFPVQSILVSYPSLSHTLPQPRGNMSSQDLEVTQNYKGKRNFTLTETQQYLCAHIRKNRPQIIFITGQIEFWISVTSGALVLFPEHKVFSFKSCSSPSLHSQFDHPIASPSPLLF